LENEELTCAELDAKEQLYRSPIRRPDKGKSRIVGLQGEKDSGDGGWGEKWGTNRERRNLPVLVNKGEPEVANI